MVNISYGQVYATYVVLTQRVLYGQTIPMVFQILLAIGSQCIGFCVGGLLRQFVVWPSSMIWPGVLVDCVFFNTLHNNYNKANQGHMTRNKFFWIAMAGSFIWYWIPGYLFTALSMFNWLCWITPNNVVINILFGTNSGLGMSVLTFDWAMISSLVNPLTTPVGRIYFFGLAHRSRQLISSGGPKWTSELHSFLFFGLLDQSSIVKKLCHAFRFLLIQTYSHKCLELSIPPYFCSHPIWQHRLSLCCPKDYYKWYLWPC